jgi:hypothetical protein
MRSTSEPSEVRIDAFYPVTSSNKTKLLGQSAITLLAFASIAFSPRR